MKDKESQPEPQAKKSRHYETKNVFLKGGARIDSSVRVRPEVRVLQWAPPPLTQ